ncbi:hypothetical protein MRB53_008583 [Persea americana]|uniref:Uncharacterized protein n=1 Tax=Persea americana TaxID=3435 RepID=A0ACC2MN62_PERAE|nr:hypothetical protein MRB53_008583 [Persea americana]
MCCIALGKNTQKPTHVAPTTWSHLTKRNHSQALPSLIDPPPELDPSIAEAVSSLSPKLLKGSLFSFNLMISFLFLSTKGEGKSKKASDAMLNTLQKVRSFEKPI